MEVNSGTQTLPYRPGPAGLPSPETLKPPGPTSSLPSRPGSSFLFLSRKGALTWTGWDGIRVGGRGRSPTKDFLNRVGYGTLPWCSTV